jgi:hypothetical protein
MIGNKFLIPIVAVARYALYLLKRLVYARGVIVCISKVYDEQQCTSLASPLALVEQYCIAVERLR